jgi:hypothetical protein
MNRPPAASGLGLGGWGHRRGGRKRTLADTFLIAVWVVGYAVVLWAFRAAKAIEDMFATLGRVPRARLWRGNMELEEGTNQEKDV